MMPSKACAITFAKYGRKASFHTASANVPAASIAMPHSSVSWPSPDSSPRRRPARARAAVHTLCCAAGPATRNMMAETSAACLLVHSSSPTRRCSRLPCASRYRDHESDGQPDLWCARCHVLRATLDTPCLVWPLSAKKSCAGRSEVENVRMLCSVEHKGASSWVRPY